MRTLRQEHEAEAELASLRFMQASLRQAHPDREYSLGACARMRDNADGRVKTRDSEEHVHIYLDSKPQTDGARDMNELLARAGDTTPTRTHDATTARRLYTERQDGQLDPRYSEGLPDYVEQRVSLGASRRSNQPWAARGFDEPAAADVTANRALNEANKAYYEGPGQGHEPGRVRSYGPDYGETGESDNDYGAYHVSGEGHDDTPTRRSAPPPDHDGDGSYLSPMAAERQFRSPVSPNQRPPTQGYPDDGDPTGWGVLRNQERANRRTTSQGFENYGVASPNAGTNPDRWTSQRGASPTMFNPNGAGGGGSAMGGDQAHIRYLNNFNRRKYGDAPIRGPLPALQRDDAGAEVVDWVGHRSFGGRSV